MSGGSRTMRKIGAKFPRFAPTLIIGSHTQARHKQRASQGCRLLVSRFVVEHAVGLCVTTPLNPVPGHALRGRWWVFMEASEVVLHHPRL